MALLNLLLGQNGINAPVIVRLFQQMSEQLSQISPKQSPKSAQGMTVPLINHSGINERDKQAAHSRNDFSLWWKNRILEKNANRQLKEQFGATLLLLPDNTGNRINNSPALISDIPAGRSTHTNTPNDNMSSHHHPPPEFNPLNDISRVLNSHPPSPIQSLLAESFQLILTALRDFGPKNVALSFNGGKDCTILLHLLYAAHQAYIRDTATSNDTSKEDIRIPTLYVACHDPFPQVESFVTECVDRYHLNLTRLSTPLKPALAHFLASTNPIPTAILLGTRSTDPHSSHLKPLHPTDPSWPAITRVHPILQWSYADVWTGINLLGIPTCELYRAGYTSLGGRGDTCPNPALLKPDSTYHPAEWLLDGCRERDGRGVKPPAPAIISSDSGLVVANAEMERVLDSAAP